MARPYISQEQRLLAFSRAPEKHTILDSHGRVQQVELAAQIHGMFFLSEMSAPSGEGMVVQPELVCYRRNLFKISGTATMLRGPLSVIAERGERIPIASMEVTVSATESVDGHSVKLIVIPWKTPPPKSPAVSPGQEHEPAPIPLQPLDVSGPEGNTGFSVYPVSYSRLQFRIATANNGRRRELRQHFTLHLDVVATLANDTKVNVCETATAPIVVRGRNPSNFKSNEDIPLIDSSTYKGGPPQSDAFFYPMPPATLSYEASGCTEPTSDFFIPQHCPAIAYTDQANLNWGVSHPQEDYGHMYTSVPITKYQTPIAHPMQYFYAADFRNHMGIPSSPPKP